MELLPGPLLTCPSSSHQAHLFPLHLPLQQHKLRWMLVDFLQLIPILPKILLLFLLIAVLLEKTLWCIGLLLLVVVVVILDIFPWMEMVIPNNICPRLLCFLTAFSLQVSRLVAEI